MSRSVRKQRLRLTSSAAVELEPGLLLPAGTYTGESTEIGALMLDGEISWTQPEFRMEFSAAELSAMGRKDTKNLLSMKITVTKFVRLGQLVIS